MSRHLFVRSAAAIFAATALSLAACSSDAEDDTKDAVESVQDDVETKTDEAAARAAAEELRTRMKANDTANEEGVRSMAALEESAEDLTGDPTVEGIEDTDGDGMDDDGKVQVDVGDSSACLTLPETGEDTTVEGGAC